MIALSKIIRPKDNTIKVLKVIHEPYRYQVSVISINATTKPPPQVYIVKIDCNTERLQPNSLIKGYCDCHDFRYRQAYCWWVNDALLLPPAFVLQPPEKTNPDCKLKMCKHMATAVQYILTKRI